ncbi:hypothetical protein SB49_13425 [Sediminicola sp. YIK13]|uniref:hypothetical protein n=1 Tax=Sediminicola sp. YIK13 TaxID=1453352 RepID=UPI00071F9681|nr:hypothetical protein [Sediminicola sp. YIK13]ALM08699.1 hypothetical protein SB49_13425 [Sediminicola sp. YIK13]
MRKYFIGISAIALTLISCNKKVTADFEITNNTGSTIDSLKIGAKKSQDAHFISLKPEEKVIYKADMGKHIKTDTSYIISYKLNDETIKLPFSYLINGDPIDKLIYIDIQKDTLSMDIEF